MGVLALFWWSGSREESLVHRLQGIVSPGGEAPSTPSVRVREWVSRLRGKSDPVARKSEEIVARVTSDVTSGHQLLLTQAGYRSGTAGRVHGWGRNGSALLFPGAPFA